MAVINGCQSAGAICVVTTLLCDADPAVLRFFMPHLALTPECTCWSSNSPTNQHTICTFAICNLQFARSRASVPVGTWQGLCLDPAHSFFLSLFLSHPSEPYRKCIAPPNKRIPATPPPLCPGLPCTADRSDPQSEDMSNTERDVNKLVCLGKADSVQKLIMKSGADPDGRFKGVPHIIAAARAGVCLMFGIS